MGRSILVVEDDRDFALQLVSMFEFQGLDVATAATGPDALRMFSEQPADLVLVDVMLPESHGLTVIDTLRSLPGGGDVPVIMMSAVYGPGDLSERDLDRLGVLEYLSKPFSLMDLGRRATALLGRPDGGRAAVRVMRENARGDADPGGVDMVTDSMTAIPDFVADALADLTDDGEGDEEPDFGSPFGSDTDDSEIVIDDDDEEFELDADASGGSDVDFATGSMAALSDEDLDDGPTVSGFHLIADEEPEPSPPRAAPPAAPRPAPPPAPPSAGPMGDFEIEVDMGRSGSFAPVGSDGDIEAPKGDPVVLVRMMAGQDALPHRVVSALAAAHLSGAAGRLRVKTATESRDLYLLNGYPVWATTEPFEDGLPAWLVREQRVTGAEGGKIVNLHRKRNWAVPRIMGALQRFRPEEVDELLQAWVTDQTAALLNCKGRMSWEPGDDWASDVSVYEVNPVRALWPSVLTIRLGRIELDLAHRERQTLARTPDALRLLDRLPATSALNRLQAALAQPTEWGDLLPTDVDKREESLRLLWLLDAAGCLTDDEGADRGVESPRSGIETRRIPRSAVKNLNLDASDEELRIQADWLAKMGQDAYEFLELPPVVDAQAVRVAYSRQSTLWRLDANATLANADTARKAKELQSKLRSSFQAVLSEVQDQS
jgi:CheY-like chemotaxis protein